MLKLAQESEGGELDLAAETVRHPVPRLGVAIFDEMRKSGWAALADGEPFRFRAPSDLPTDCIWVCQIDATQFRDEFRGMAHLRPSDYLSKLSYIASDLGYRIDGSGKFGELAREAVGVLAPTIHRSVVIAAQAYGWSNPAHWLKSNTLIEDVQKYLTELVPVPPIKPYMRAPLAAAYQTYSSVGLVTGFHGQGAVKMTLRFNRLQYAQRIMATTLPGGGFSLEEAQVSLDRALDPERPCLARVTVEFSQQDEELAALCAYGSMPKRSVLRTWMCQEELAWISKFATVQVTGLCACEGTQPIPRSLQLPPALTADPVFELSIPVGLVAEAHWRALARDHYKATVEGKREYPPMGVWLRAADRAMCFQLALAAHRAGFRVSGYGNGSVSVDCDPQRLPALLDFAMENEVAHPVFKPVFREFGLLNRD